MHAKAAKEVGLSPSTAQTAAFGDVLQVNVAAASQQELIDWLALLRRCAKEVRSVKLLCHRNSRNAAASRGSGRSGARQAGAGQPPRLTLEQHRAVVAEASAKLSSDKLRGGLPDALCKVVLANSLLHFELSVKLPMKMYEQLATALMDNSSLEVLSLAGSCCGDAALAALATALTNLPKLQVLELPGCCLSDTTAGRLAVILKAHGAAAAQQAWVDGLRGGGSRSSSSKVAQGPCTAAAADHAQGLRVLDASQNQITISGLRAIAAALSDEHSSLMHLNLAGNHLPGTEAAAHCILQALQQDPPSRNFTVDLTGNYGPPEVNSAANEETPTIPGLGIWAGVLQYSGHAAAVHSSGMAAAAAGMHACRPRSRKQGMRADAGKGDISNNPWSAADQCNKISAGLSPGVPPLAAQAVHPQAAHVVHPQAVHLQAVQAVHLQALHSLAVHPQAKQAVQHPAVHAVYHQAVHAQAPQAIHAQAVHPQEIHPHAVQTYQPPVTLQMPVQQACPALNPAVITAADWPAGPLEGQPLAINPQQQQQPQQQSVQPNALQLHAVMSTPGPQAVPVTAVTQVDQPAVLETQHANLMQQQHQLQQQNMGCFSVLRCMSQQTTAAQNHPMSLQQQQAQPSHSRSNCLQQFQHRVPANVDQTESWIHLSPLSSAAQVTQAEHPVAATGFVVQQQEVQPPAKSWPCISSFKQQQVQHQQVQHLQCASSSCSSTSSDRRASSPMVPAAQAFLLEAVRQQQQALQWLLLQQQGQQEQREQQQGSDPVEDEMLTELTMVMCDLSEKVTLLEQLHSSSYNDRNAGLSSKHEAEPAAVVLRQPHMQLTQGCYEPPRSLQKQEQQHARDEPAITQRLHQIEQTPELSSGLATAANPCINAARVGELDLQQVNVQVCHRAASQTSHVHTGSSLRTDCIEGDECSSSPAGSDSCVGGSTASSPASTIDKAEPPAWCKDGGIDKWPAVESISRQLLHLHGLS